MWRSGQRSVGCTGRRGCRSRRSLGCWGSRRTWCGGCCGLMHRRGISARDRARSWMGSSRGFGAVAGVSGHAGNGDRGAHRLDELDHGVAGLGPGAAAGISAGGSGLADHVPDGGVGRLRLPRDHQPEAPRGSDFKRWKGASFQSLLTPSRPSGRTGLVPSPGARATRIWIV